MENIGYRSYETFRTDRKPRSTKKVAKSLTIPDQSLSLKEIVRRYVRGVPVDVKHHTPVFIDQQEHDFEALARSEFSEKMSLAEELKAKYDAQIEALNKAREAKQSEKVKSEIRAEIQAEFEEEKRAEKPVSIVSP